MEDTVTIKGTATSTNNNMLFDGDFIDLTSENELQPQKCNEDEADVVMLNDAPRLQTQANISPTVDTSIKKAGNANSCATKQATMLVSSPKTSQQFLIPIKLTTTPNGTHILLQPPCNKDVGQLVPQVRGEIKQTGVTAVRAMPPLHRTVPSGGLSPKKTAQSNVLLQNMMQKTVRVSKNLGDTSPSSLPSEISQKSLKTLKKSGPKANINPVAMQRYKVIKPAPSTSTVPSNFTQNVKVEDAVLLPSSSETDFKETIKKRYQDNVPISNLTANQPKFDQVSLLPSQSENKSKPQILSVTTLAPPSTLKLQQMRPRPNTNLDSINSDDDVIVIPDDPKKDESKKPKEIQTILSLPINVLKQGQLLGSANSTISSQETIPVQKKYSDKGYVFLTPQIPLSGLQRKKSTSPKTPMLIQTVKESRHSRTPLKKLQSHQKPQNVVIKKNITTDARELEIVEHDLSLKQSEENLGISVPVEAVEGTVGDQPVYFLLYSGENDESSSRVIDDAYAESCPVIPKDEIELTEPKIEPEFDDVYTIESDNEEYPLEHVIQPKVAPSCIVTPVDITQILNEGKTAQKTDLKDRCNCVPLKNMRLYRKGFTKREMRKAYCARYLQTFIKREENKIKELKKSSFHRSNFIICGKTFNNFLPETSQCDDGDPEDYVIEYNNIEQRLTEEIYNSETLPVITNVISKVNDEVLQMRTQHLKAKKRESEADLQAKLAKPEEALKLIKRGLELIKSWSKETYSEKEKANKPLPITSRKRTAPPVEIKRKRHSAPIETVAEPPKKITRLRKNEGPKKNEVPKKKEVLRKNETPKKNDAPAKREEPRQQRKRTPTEKALKANVSVGTVKEMKKKTSETRMEVKIPAKRGRKPKNKVDFNSVDDNELFVIKKVDILNSTRNK